MKRKAKNRWKRKGWHIELLTDSNGAARTTRWVKDKMDAEPMDPILSKFLASARVGTKIEELDKESDEIEKRRKAGRRLVGPIWRNYTLVCFTPKKWEEGVRHIFLHGHVGFWHIITDDNRKMQFNEESLNTYLFLFSRTRPEKVFKRVIYEEEK